VWCVGSYYSQKALCGCLPEQGCIVGEHTDDVTFRQAPCERLCPTLQSRPLTGRLTVNWKLAGQDDSRVTDRSRTRTLAKAGPGKS
jgi:hypothetical protein